MENVSSGVAISTGGTAVACGATLCLSAGATVAAGTAVAVYGATQVAQGGMGLGSNLELLGAAKPAYIKNNLLGAKGPQITSKNLWQGDQGRLDVENPNPGNRPGQIHFQQGNNKWLYDPVMHSFKSAKGTYIDPPSWLYDLLKQRAFQHAIEKGLKYLGEIP